MSDETTNNYGAFIWSVADLLRGVYKQSEYGRVNRRIPGEEKQLFANGRQENTQWSTTARDC